MSAIAGLIPLDGGAIDEALKRRLRRDHAVRA